MTGRAGGSVTGRPGDLVPDLTTRLRHRFAVTGADATPAAVAVAVRDEPGTALLGSGGLLSLADQVHRDLSGAGPLATLLADPSVTDVLVNGPGEVWVDRGAGLVKVAVPLGGPDELRRLAQRMVALCGRRLDDACPFADAYLPDGTRVHAVLPPVATGGPLLSLRTFRRRPFTLAELVSAGTVAPPTADLLHAIVRARLAYLVTGGTGAGKSTLLACLLGLVPAGERIVLVEDSAELRPVHPHVVGLQARVSNVEGAGSVTLRDLVRQALRMRPDRLVVGECRGAEVVDLLAALNTGHDGGAGTLHANTPADVPARLEALGLLGGLDRPALHAQVAAAVQVVVHMRRGARGRTVEEICVLLPAGTSRLVVAVGAWRRRGGPGPAAAVLARMLGDRGVAAPVALDPDRHTGAVSPGGPAAVEASAAARAAVPPQRPEGTRW